MPRDEDAADSPAHIAWQLADQARSCEAMGSPLYALLLRHAARDASEAGVVHRLLRRHAAPGRGGALALRLMAAVHILVLRGEAPELARHYPSVGGSDDPQGAWAAFVRVIGERGEVLHELVERPCQTNEVGRCAGLAVGFLEAAARTGLPLRLREIGASAGLNLRWDHFRYGGAGTAFGPPDSPVNLTGLWQEAPPHTATSVTVVERRGCDPDPVDPGSEEGRLALTASVWADQVERHTRLRGALAVAEHVPAHVDDASVQTWLPEQLAEPSPGAVTVVYHSVVEEYLSHEVRDVVRRSLEDAGARATPDAPLAWVRLEPVSAVRRHGVTMRLWPGPAERLLATCGAHGQDVRLTPATGSTVGP